MKRGRRGDKRSPATISKRRRRPLLEPSPSKTKTESSDESSAVEFRHESILKVRRSPSPDSSLYEGFHPESPLSSERMPRHTGMTLERKPGVSSTPAPKQMDALCSDENFEELRKGKMFGTQFSAVNVGKEGMGITGSVWVSVIRGNVRILGATLSAVSEPALIVSAPIASFVVKVCPQVLKEDSLPESKPSGHSSHAEALIHCKIRETTKKLGRDSSEDACILLFTAVDGDRRSWADSDTFQISSDIGTTIKEYAACAGLPSVARGRELVRGMTAIGDNGKTPMFEEWSNWAAVTKSIDDYILSPHSRPPFRLVVCGAGGTGKSTFVRCITNHMLGHQGNVVLIDSDVGQPEMNPPGLIAAHLVSGFRLGAAAASNRMVPIAAYYLGEVTAREEPDLYAKYVADVTRAGLEFAKKHNCPVIVNSHGWISGVGASLVRHLVNCVEPSHVAELKFAETSQRPVLAEICSRVPTEHCYQLVSPREARSTTFSAGSMRELHIASYFSKELALGRVYKVPMEEVSVVPIGDWVGSHDLYAALNASLVALAVQSESDCSEDKDFAVRGLGMVRAVDPVNELLFICTPIPQNVLISCDTLLVSGGVQIPHALFLALAAERTSQAARSPYVCAGSISTGEPMRSRATLNRR